MELAATATTNSNSDTPANVNGSVGVTPNSMVARKRVSRNEATIPMPIPSAVTSKLCLRIRLTMLLVRAPIAIRTLIS